MASPFFPEVIAAWQAARPNADGEIPADLFLEAASKFVPIFDRLGTIFTPVKSDVGGNVEKLKKSRANNAAATTLQQLIRAEKAAGTHKDKNGASTALLWFKRAMQFIFRLLEKVAAGTDANKAAKEAYAETLSHYHGFMVKNTFGVGLMAAPSTATMLPCLGSDSALTLQQMQEWVTTAAPFLESIHAFLIAENLDDSSKV
uniref:Glycolipid transfer protein domain-containing protein n=1 Tax=Cryptomonas curvata TaxID=233186 RepID=A0A7S0N890_9CRYP|mmetsp:Transcript_6748/g.14660  ORF Transcript_6748/g.14660 Transcript_6748/m.14660 type:complete len:202 (+) Transcript_6748:86-691(+)|eukprot:CAMPEP_0172165532 /NCGR_PEP_ID=MMETSP1050-20130122/8466_1 /TAXON_ID=233186 /ORGANISM="Cryptomonas curvata, Strain CCAP979/52" /LENGTH=201 /DNA_ID=CAMNT_0012836017 /DNA_START=43 /DNA_END=648 /DNA_ORIENTATION=+